MSYEYQPKFPKAKLREIVNKYIAVMQSLGKAPNCGIAFVGADGTVSAADVRGWLLKDTRPESAGNRYVLLFDGDVWREVASPAPEATQPDGAPVWLNGPDDDLVTLLMRSQANVRMGRDSFLEAEENVELGRYVVGDRRSEHQPYQGPERRTRE